MCCGQVPQGATPPYTKQYVVRCIATKWTQTMRRASKLSRPTFPFKLPTHLVYTDAPPPEHKKEMADAPTSPVPTTKTKPAKRTSSARSLVLTNTMALPEPACSVMASSSAFGFWGNST